MGRDKRRQRRLELRGLLGFVAMFLGRRKKEKIAELLMSVEMLLGSYEANAEAIKRINETGKVNKDDEETVVFLIEDIDRLIEAVKQVF